MQIVNIKIKTNCTNIDDLDHLLFVYYAFNILIAYWLVNSCAASLKVILTDPR